MYAIIVRACKEKSRHVCLRSKFNHIKTSLLMDTFPKVMKLCFPLLQVSINKTDSIVHFQNGSEIHFAGLDDDKRTEKILGKEFSTIFFNECSQIDYRSVTIALTRLAEKNGLSKRAYYDENPPSKSHWSYYLFLKKLNPNDNVPIKDRDNYASMLMNPIDNIKNIDSGYLSMLDELPGRDRLRFRDGVFLDTDDGSAYYAFDFDKHVKPCKRENGTIFIFMDFNVLPLTACFAQVQNGKLIIFDEMFLSSPSDTYKACAEFKRRGYHGIVIPDSTGRNRKTSGMSDFKILEENGFVIESTVNPLVRDRVNNVNRLFNNEMIIIDSKCVKLINDLQKVSWKDGDLFEGHDKMLTHISDSLGYGCWRLFPMQDKKVNRTIQF